ncbi:MAG: hypothetical protein KFF68_06595 [Desulfosarcina sp.]|nr:hypothetical protein [Desulfosarcina sp.]
MNMLHASYGIWGVCIIVLLLGFWIIKRCFSGKSPKTASELDRATFNTTGQDHDVEHRALMFLMAQKTDSILAALAQTIMQERQKLGGVVRNPSNVEAVETFQPAALPVSTSDQSSHDQILPMAHEGIAVATIARQLQLPEAEVCMVMRLNAA